MKKVADCDFCADNRADMDHGDTKETLAVNSEEEGQRLDQFLRSRYSNFSRAYFQRRIENGQVCLNGEQCSRSDKVAEGDVITILWISEEPPALTPQPVDFEVIHEDDDVLVINKPPGVVVHPNDAYQHNTLVNGLLYYDEPVFSAMVDAQRRPGIVHRLDKDTSGVMVIAKNLEARSRLKESFKKRLVDKTYLAIVSGEFGVRAGRIEGDIGRHPVNRIKMAVVEEGGKHAGTRYRVLGNTPETTLLEVNIETGRTHQIRVHFSHLHHPVLGDGLYGGPRSLSDKKIPRQMLHAWKLVFPHPRTGVSREYRADLPTDFCEVLRTADLPLIAGCNLAV
ncbi:MAG: RluA family pseudouridine synthase [Lentisphaeria bacterium]